MLKMHLKLLIVLKFQMRFNGDLKLIILQLMEIKLKEFIIFFFILSIILLLERNIIKIILKRIILKIIKIVKKKNLLLLENLNQNMIRLMNILFVIVILKKVIFQILN